MLASLWHHLLNRLGLLPAPARRQYQLDEQYQAVIVELAQQEHRSEDEIHANLLASALAHRNAIEELWNCWQTLSQRERDVAALTCQGYTNRQIAAKLKLSPDTVKGYVRQVLVKFNLHSKNELRTLLSTWDFGDWGLRAPY